MFFFARPITSRLQVVDNNEKRACYYEGRVCIVLPRLKTAVEAT